MKPTEGLAVQLVAAEPLVRQPVTITFDSQGRLWVIQYLQYPSPAGLKPVEVDRYLRTKYDRHPEPPPRGPRGLDRVTILFDPDQQGRFRQSKDFVSGLNLASGLALGHGGVYVLQAPYLLFYPDRNNDDIPDGDPEVLLDGFGLEDAHAVGNSLIWGPDGWLYGAQGSTVTAHIKDPLTKKRYEFQQGIWRYHPRTRQFELFAEGGGNTWGLDFTPDGNVIAGTNYGGVAALHMVQSGYYVKGFAKHGPLHNPYTFGYFDHLQCQNFGGGHVTCGGIVYAGGLLPDRFKNNYLACNLLDNNLYWYSLQPKGSSFTMRQEGTLLQGNDPWFRPIDLLTGPDGAVYIVDWYDKRANHVDPVDNWDKTNGRIYKLISEGHPTTRNPGSLKQATTNELIKHLESSNSWLRTEARRLLSESTDLAVQGALQAYHEQQPEKVTVDSLGALYSCDGLTVQLAEAMLQHTKPDVRQWTVRLVTDHATPDGLKRYSTLIPKLIKLARLETDPRVLSQLASTARRLIDATGQTDSAYSLVRELIQRQEVIDDSHLPLLVWWAIEAGITWDQEQFNLPSLLLDHHATWQTKYVRDFLMERLAQRLAASKRIEAMSSLIALLKQAMALSDQRATILVLKGIETAWEGKQFKEAPPAFVELLNKAELHQGLKQQVLRLQIRCLDARARTEGISQLTNKNGSESDRSQLLKALCSADNTFSLVVIQHIWSGTTSESYRLAILDVLDTRQDAVSLFHQLLKESSSSRNVRSRLLAMILARKETAVQLGESIARGEIAPKELTLDQVQQLARYRDVSLNAVVAKHWGSVTEQTTGEKRARIQSVIHMLGQRKGQAANGKSLFEKHCSACHQLFGEGGKVGPDLTSADRHSREYLVTQVVDPHLVVRPEYVAQTIVTVDGRTYHGLLAEQNPGSIVLVDAQANRISFMRDKIETLEPSRLSLMPEKLLDTLDDDQIRDLFAYLQQPVSQQPVSPTLPFPASLIPEPVNYDFADKMLNGIDRFLDKETAAAEQRRTASWLRNSGSVEMHQHTLEDRRRRLRLILGVVEERPKPPEMEYISSPLRPAKVGRGAGYDIFSVRWRAFAEVHAEGYLLVPDGKPQADIVVLPDADQSPESIVGLILGKSGNMSVANRLAQSGCRVLVPLLVDRDDTYAGIPNIKMTNQPHREWIYRQAFEMGRHIIGYEVLKVLAAIDWFHATQEAPRAIGLLGYAEGGLLALHAGALDDRIKVTGVDGYFGNRKALWQEPIYRNVWGQHNEFGDAEIAGLYAPRVLLLGQSSPPVVKGPPAVRAGRSGAAPGQLGQLDFVSEWNRLDPARRLFHSSFIKTSSLTRSEESLQDFFQHLTGHSLHKSEGEVQCLTTPPDAGRRMQQQVKQLAEHTQKLQRQSQTVREQAFWNKTDRNSLAKYMESTAPFRSQLENEVIGRIEKPLTAPRPRARKINEQPGYVTYEVELDVIAPDIIAYGLLLVPKDIKPGERRPVVVCQHGLDGRPSALADPQINHPAYNQYGCRLAERGFIVFAPQNPYLFGDRFRLLQRKANPLGLSLFSFIVAQHRQLTEWLATLPFVDGNRIGFYGLSYGGKTAMRVPALVPRYCLSICSADFNEWIWKNVSIDNRFSYVLTGEWEMVEWNLGHTFNYAEMAALIAPRPFMVERGHRDGVAPDEQVAYEYAKVRRLYADLKISERTTIEFFDGPHTIHGQGTFHFLHQHLKWPDNR